MADDLNAPLEARVKELLGKQEIPGETEQAPPVDPELYRFSIRDAEVPAHVEEEFQRQRNAAISDLRKRSVEPENLEVVFTVKSFECVSETKNELVDELNIGGSNNTIDVTRNRSLITGRETGDLQFVYESILPIEAGDSIRVSIRNFQREYLPERIACDHYTGSMDHHPAPAAIEGLRSDYGMFFAYVARPLEDVERVLRVEKLRDGKTVATYRFQGPYDEEDEPRYASDDVEGGVEFTEHDGLIID